MTPEFENTHSIAHEHHTVGFVLVVEDSWSNTIGNDKEFDIKLR